MKYRKLKMGMIGGGPGSFIGTIHRMAARLDGEIEIVCGCFSSDPDKSKLTGIELNLLSQRVYSNYFEMFDQEQKLPLEERMDFVSIVTPNHLHFKPAKKALEHGFHVVLDKPMTFNYAEAKELEQLVNNTGLIFCLTHTYTGYPMVKEARQQILRGNLGTVRKVFVEYPQGWLSDFIEAEHQKQAEWRTDPARSGMGGAIGDIGTHAFNLAEYITGLKVVSVCADLNTVVEGRKLDDDATVLLKFDNGASGVLIATQVAAGEENSIKIRVYGDKGGLEWKQEEMNSLLLKWKDKPMEIHRAGAAYLSKQALHNCRTPPGHPEGWIEAFANHYRNFALTVKAKMTGEVAKDEWLDFPGVAEGVRGMAFIEAVIKSASSEEKWLGFK